MGNAPHAVGKKGGYPGTRPRKGKKTKALLLGKEGVYVMKIVWFVTNAVLGRMSCRIERARPSAPAGHHSN